MLVRFHWALPLVLFAAWSVSQAESDTLKVADGAEDQIRKNNPQGKRKYKRRARKNQLRRGLGRHFHHHGRPRHRVKQHHRPEEHFHPHHHGPKGHFHPQHHGPEGHFHPHHHGPEGHFHPQHHGPEGNFHPHHHGPEGHFHPQHHGPEDHLRYHLGHRFHHRHPQDVPQEQFWRDEAHTDSSGEEHHHPPHEYFWTQEMRTNPHHHGGEFGTHHDEMLERRQRQWLHQGDSTKKFRHGRPLRHGHWFYTKKVNDEDKAKYTVLVSIQEYLRKLTDRFWGTKEVPAVEAS